MRSHSGEADGQLPRRRLSAGGAEPGGYDDRVAEAFPFGPISAEEAEADLEKQARDFFLIQRRHFDHLAKSPAANNRRPI